MTAAQINATFFNPIADIFYLLLILTISSVWLMWKWGKTRRNFVRVVIIRADGSTDEELAPKSGGSVTLTKPGSNVSRSWPISKLASIEKTYPGDGFIPWFMKGKIREVIVDEEDFEPLLNRSAYSKHVASPDVIATLKALAEELKLDDKTAKKGEAILAYASTLAKAPTRSLIASPAVFGNLMMEKVTEMLITVNKEMLDKVEGLMHKLDNVVTATKLYVCVGIVVAAIGFSIFMTYPLKDQIEKQTHDIQLIKTALGIVEITMNSTDAQGK